MSTRMIAFRGVVGLLLATVALPALGQTDPGRTSYSRMLNIEALMEAHVRALTRRYNLSEEQEAYTLAFLRERANTFLDRHREDLFNLIDRMVEVRAGGEMTQEELLAWGQQALPLYEQAKALIVQGNNEWREILTDDQRRTHDEDLQEMYGSFVSTEDQLQRIVTGQMTLDEFRRGPARQVPRPTQPLRSPGVAVTHEATPVERTPRTSATPIQEASPTVSDSGGAVAVRPSRKTEVGSTAGARGDQPARGRGIGTAPSAPGRGGTDFESQWEAYVREFIAKYQLDEAQTQRAQSVLKDCQDAAQRIMQKNKTEIEQLDQKLLALGDKKEADKLKELSELSARRAKLLEPINEIFEKQLKPRLERLPTRAQRQAAEAAGKPAPGTPPAQGRPGRPAPQPQPPPPPPEELPPEAEPLPPEQDVGP